MLSILSGKLINNSLNTAVREPDDLPISTLWEFIQNGLQCGRNTLQIIPSHNRPVISLKPPDPCKATIKSMEVESIFLVEQSVNQLKHGVRSAVVPPLQAFSFSFGINWV